MEGYVMTEHDESNLKPKCVKIEPPLQIFSHISYMAYRELNQAKVWTYACSSDSLVKIRLILFVGC